MSSMSELQALIAAIVKAIKSGTFKPLKFTDQRGARRFSILPAYSFQARHVMLDIQAHGKLLTKSGLRSQKDSSLAQHIVRQEYFKLFNMAKIGCPILESLENEHKMFWDRIMTGGYDVFFIFTKPKKNKAGKQLEPSAFKDIVNDENTIVWGVDPGVSEVFVTVDGDAGKTHRIRPVSAEEYYDICGFSNATETRKEYLDQNPDTKKLIDGIPK